MLGFIAEVVLGVVLGEAPGQTVTQGALHSQYVLNGAHCLVAVLNVVLIARLFPILFFCFVFVFF